MSLDLKKIQEGEVLLIDKPLDWTSYQVVNKVKYAVQHKLKIKNFKIGHAGTLDPRATGLLILGTGKCTKLLESIQAGQKTYTGTFLLGATTPCYDTERPVDKEYPGEHITQEILENARQRFLGEIDQIPPVFSAIKVDGKALYKDAHKGKEQETPAARRVQIFDFQIFTENLPTVGFRVECSKGTYIRSLAHDFGQACTSGAYLTTLRREASGEYDVANAWKLEDLIEEIKNAALLTE